MFNFVPVESYVTKYVEALLGECKAIPLKQIRELFL